LWPKGNCWYGGGIFEDNERIFLNHQPDEAEPHPKHQPEGLNVVANPDARGEDDPIYSLRLTRDGWKLTKEWVFHYKSGGFVTEQPEERVLCNPKEKYLELVMRRSLSGFCYREEYEVLNTKLGRRTPLMNAECASWDQRGRLALLSQGKLYIGRLDEDNELRQEELRDFNNQKPQEIDSPAWAKRW